MKRISVIFFRLLILLWAIIAIFGLTACGGGGEGYTSSADSAPIKKCPVPLAKPGGGEGACFNTENQ